MEFFEFFFGEIIAGSIFRAMLMVFRAIGLLWIRLFCWDDRSIKELHDAYKEKPITWVLGLGTIIVLVVWLL